MQPGLPGRHQDSVIASGAGGRKKRRKERWMRAKSSFLKSNIKSFVVIVQRPINAKVLLERSQSRNMICYKLFFKCSAITTPGSCVFLSFLFNQKLEQLAELMFISSRGKENQLQDCFWKHF